MVELRRSLHRRPEIGLQNPYAQAAVLAAIGDLDLTVRTGHALTSVVATLAGAHDGPTVLLRADTDALPVDEETGLAYASEVPGAMHACGHDAHTAMLVGAARLLHEQRSELAGRVVFAFQPGEEGAGGASAMIAEGLLDGVDAAFALHITPEVPTGTVVTRAGPLMAAADDVTITVDGRGGHGSLPHETIDPIPVACMIVTQLAAVAAAVTEVWDATVLTVGRIHAGTAPNVVPDRAEIAGTLRTVSETARKAVLQRIETLAASCAAAHGATATVHTSQPCPVTVNDVDVTRVVRAATTDLLGADAMIDLPNPVMASEDFAEITARVPGAMAFLGAGAADLDSGPVHSGRLLIDERAMAHGADLHAGVAWRLLTALR